MFIYKLGERGVVRGPPPSPPHIFVTSTPPPWNNDVFSFPASLGRPLPPPSCMHCVLLVEEGARGYGKDLHLVGAQMETKILDTEELFSPDLQAEGGREGGGSKGGGRGREGMIKSTAKVASQKGI